MTQIARPGSTEEGASSADCGRQLARWNRTSPYVCGSLWANRFAYRLPDAYGCSPLANTPATARIRASFPCVLCILWSNLGSAW